MFDKDLRKKIIPSNLAFNNLMKLAIQTKNNKFKTSNKNCMKNNNNSDSKSILSLIPNHIEFFLNNQVIFVQNSF